MEALLINKDRMYKGAANQTTRAVIFTTRPSQLAILEVLNWGRSVKTVYLANSYIKSMAPSTARAIDMLGVKVLPTPKKVHGLRTDIHGSWAQIEEEAKTDEVV